MFTLNNATVSPEAGLKLCWVPEHLPKSLLIALNEDAKETLLVLMPRSLFNDVDYGSDIVMDVMNDDRIKKVSVPFHSELSF